MKNYSFLRIIKFLRTNEFTKIENKIMYIILENAEVLEDNDKNIHIIINLSEDRKIKRLFENKNINRTTLFRFFNKLKEQNIIEENYKEIITRNFFVMILKEGE